MCTSCAVMSHFSYQIAFEIDNLSPADVVVINLLINIL